MSSNSGCVKAKLSVRSLGFGFGIAEAVYLLVFAWLGLYFGYGLPMIQEIASVFHGYAPTLLGGVYGAIWGFIDGFIFGVIAGYAYNCCFRCCYKSCGSADKDADKK